MYSIISFKWYFKIFLLLAGMSLLSFVELSEVFVHVFVYLLQGKRRRRSKIKETHQIHQNELSSKQFLDNVKRDIIRLKMDAVPNIFHSNHLFFSIMWIVLFFAFATLCVYFMMASVHQFLAYQVTTTAQYLKNDGELYESLDIAVLPTRGWSAGNEIVYCTLGNSKGCEWEFFGETHNTNPWYRFRFQPSAESVDRKLELIIILKALEYYVYVEGSSSYPLWSYPTTIETGFSNVINIKKNVYKQYQYPYSDCSVLADNSLVVDLENRSIFDQTVNANSWPYTRDVCLRFCSDYTRDMFCKSNQYYFAYYLGCTIYSNHFYSQGKTLDFSDFCYKRCPLECTSIVYTRNLFTYFHPPGYFDRYINISNKADQLADNLIELRINYDRSFYWKNSEEPKMSGENLLGTLGGHLHVFMGMSLLSFVEIIELLLFIPIRIFWRTYTQSWIQSTFTFVCW